MSYGSSCPEKHACIWRAALPAAAMALGALWLPQAQAATWTCSPDGAGSTYLFEEALDGCAPGDVIVLNPGDYTPPTSGVHATGFTLKYKGTSQSYITIQSSQLSSLAANRRVTASDQQFMPKIHARTAGQNSYSAIRTETGGANGPHHYKLLGLEMISGNEYQTAVIRLGDQSTAQNTLASVPHHIIIDRCIVRSFDDNTETIRGISVESDYTDITNCRITGIKGATSRGIDSVGIGGHNGIGHYRILNNYIEAASENILLGGGTPRIAPITGVWSGTPSDVFIQKNHLTKPASWVGSNWNVKNLFELKAGINVVAEGNLLENSWGTLQNGKAATFKTIKQSNQGASWTECQDNIFSYNLIRHAGTGIAVGGSKNTSGGDMNGKPERLTFRHNLMTDISTVLTGNLGYGVAIANGVPDQTFDHNTIFATNRALDKSGSAQHPNFTWTNNIGHKGSYTFKAPGGGDNGLLFDHYFQSGFVFQKNIVKGEVTSQFKPSYCAGTYLAGWNQNPFNDETLLVPGNWNFLAGQASPGPDYAGYKLAAGSVYRNAGTDGKDVGCDIDELMDRVGGCVSGYWFDDTFDPPRFPPLAGTRLDDSYDQYDPNWFRADQDSTNLPDLTVVNDTAFGSNVLKVAAATVGGRPFVAPFPNSFPAKTLTNIRDTIILSGKVRQLTAAPGGIWVGLYNNGGSATTADNNTSSNNDKGYCLVLGTPTSGTGSTNIREDLVGSGEIFASLPIVGASELAGLAPDGVVHRVTFKIEKTGTSTLTLTGTWTGSTSAITMIQRTVTANPLPVVTFNEVAIMCGGPAYTQPETRFDDLRVRDKVMP